MIGATELFDKTKFQVLLLSCRANLPFIFTSHTWFVINDFGKLSRWEVLFRKNKDNPLGYHLYKNKLPAFDGIGMIPYLDKPKWNSSVITVLANDEAKRIAEIIESSPQNYPYCNYYSITGPNSNSYAQWVLTKAKISNIFLPASAIGKKYKFN